MVENFFNLIAITLVIFLWAVFKIKARYNLFNKLVDRIIIGEVLDNDKEDLYKVKFILKTGEMIKDNLPNNTLKIGSDIGHYGFRINKQALEIKEDNVSAYVLRKNSYINTTSHSFPPFIKFREILKYLSYVSSQISKMYSLKLKFFQKLCNFFNIVLLIILFNIKWLI